MSDSAATLEDMNSLNLEIAALVKAGVPLEFGLRGLAGISRSQFSRLSERIADRLAEGTSLPDAMADEGLAISPLYVAVMKAGLASGRLPEALESLTATGQIIQETRRRVWLAAVYPIFCILFAYFILCFFVAVIIPQILRAADLIPKNWLTTQLKAINDHQLFITSTIPIVMLAISVLLYLFRNTFLAAPWRYLTSFRWVMGPSLNWSQFTELLALQVEHGVPLSEAIVEAAAATDNPRWHDDAREVAAELKRGKSLAVAIQSALRMPPVMRWMLASAEKQGQLAPTLRQLAEIYRRQALRRATIVKIWVPVTMTIVVTVGIGLSYALALFFPLQALLLELMKE